MWLGCTVDAMVEEMRPYLARRIGKASVAGGLSGFWWNAAYFLVLAAISAFLASVAANLRRKRSIRPAVSTSFCLPVKKGWQALQISTTIAPLWLERVPNSLPQAHLTCVSSYWG